MEIQLTLTFNAVHSTLSICLSGHRHTVTLTVTLACTAVLVVNPELIVYEVGFGPSKPM